MDLLLHLESFVAVAEVMSFSHAADELGIAQPLLSRRIKALEEHLDGPLFDRGKRQIRMTDLGALLLPQAKDLLARSEHLLAVVRSAHDAVPVPLAVPPDCDPRALARAIRAGTERGVPLRVQELPAAERTSPGDGLALVRVPPDGAPIRVRLGLAAAVPLGPPAVHLDALRTRRGAASLQRPILVTDEDSVPLAADRLRRAVARAGLPVDILRWADSTSAALAEALAGSGLLLCSEQFARRHRVGWSALADGSLHRGYDLAAGPVARKAGLRGWIEPLLAGAVGAGGDATGLEDELAGRMLATSG